MKKIFPCQKNDLLKVGFSGCVIFIAFAILFSSGTTANKPGIFLSDPDINVNVDTLTIFQSYYRGSDKVDENILFPCDRRFKKALISDIVDTIINKTGDTIVISAKGGIPPTGPREPVANPARNAVMLTNVPVFDWSFGCGPTSGAMMAGYYDNTGYPSIYLGPQNGGVCPMDNTCWGDTIINGELRKHCPLSATCLGLDGRTIRGHVDDYWVFYEHPGPDPFISNGWSEHQWEDCLGDFMGTSQSEHLQIDGYTFYDYYLNGCPSYDWDNWQDSINGCHGLREFFESRNYPVDYNFNQYIYGYNGNTQGFTLNDYRTQIDRGRPVFIHITNHTMLGIGYDPDTDTIYIHDTWDHDLHAMAWGGIYMNKQHESVTVIRLENAPEDYFTVQNTGTSDLSVDSISDDASWLSMIYFPNTPFTINPDTGKDLGAAIDWFLIQGLTTQYANVTITSNDPDEPVVTLVVEAIPLPTEPDIEIAPLSLSIQESGTVNSPGRDQKKKQFADEVDRKFVAPGNEGMSEIFSDGKGGEVVVYTMPDVSLRDVNAPNIQSRNNSVILNNAPAFKNAFGYYNTAAAMAAGYYDNNGYPNMYTGSTNNRLCPQDNSIWPDTVINFVIRSQCPLSASRNGLDGRRKNGHVDDYWISTGNAGPDPWIVNGWSEHEWGDCMGDFMGSNQSTYNMTDGQTQIILSTDGSKLYDFTGLEPSYISGCHGMREFYESRGYTVVANYTQYIYGYNGNTQGFILNDFQAEINAGRPVILWAQGLFMLGVGYIPGSDTIYIHDGLDHSLHEMKWGGQYLGLQHSAVVVVELAPPPEGYFAVENSGTDSLTISSISHSCSWLNVSGHPALPFVIPPNNIEYINIDVNWSQVGMDIQTCILTVGSDDPDEPSVQLYVNAIPDEALITQTLELDPGWNLMSFYTAPVDPDMFDLLQPLINDSNMVKTIDETGSFIQYIHGTGWLNTIGDMQNTEGYYIKINSTDTFNVTGIPLSNPFSIPLITGWNIMGYPYEQFQNAFAAVQPLVDEGNLIKLIDEAGNFIQYIPGIGWVNSIINFKADEGYHIKVLADDTLQIYEPGRNREFDNVILVLKRNLEKYTFDNFRRPFMPMHVAVTDIDLADIYPSVNDEIGVFDDGKLVGGGKFTGNPDLPFVLILSADDPLTPHADGFVEGNKISFSYWDADRNIEYHDPVLNLIQGEDVFKKLETLICSMEFNPTAITEPDTGLTFYLGHIQPNPLKDFGIVQYSLCKEAKISIHIYDIYGEQVVKLLDSRKTEGNHICRISRGNLKPGLYLLKMTVVSDTEKSALVRKLIIL